ncbi:MAG: T9SS type B sorting domain-containing protein, partial [Paludibacteraceae bacterium]|nr:T9SS type B sorting domain-containing protein [Paludibacteraceae bacterium]
IYDRYGKLIVQYLGDNSEGWDGTYEGQPLPSTDYWYMVDIEEIEKQYSGHFTLMRR